MAKHKVIVIGGGPAGLMASGQAAALGSEVILAEKKREPGRKLRITGKGRCNLTNVAPLTDFIEHYGQTGRFLRQALNRFFSEDLIAFLGERGVDIICERGGRVFPAGEDALAVAEALIEWVKESGVCVKTEHAVERLLIENGQISGVSVAGKDVVADRVIVATGGASYQATGSTGDGYALAKSAGHTIVPIRPALIPVETAGDTASRLQGLSLRNVQITVYVDGRRDQRRFGEMLFTHFGLSGPIVLSASGGIVDALRQKKKTEVSIDLKPALDVQKLDARLLRELQSHGKRQFHTMLKTLLPGRLIDVCCDVTGITRDKAGSQINSGERKALLKWLKDFRFTITGHRPLDEAIITAGGVDTREVDPRTMESKLLPGLYFAGEVLDVNGDTGGYNLQAAFSTGWLAGVSAAG